MRGFRPWRSGGFRLAVSCTEGAVFVLGAWFLTAFLVWKLGLPPMGVLRFFAGVSFTVGAFLSGRRMGLHGRHRGALEGAACGIVLEMMRVAVSLTQGGLPMHLAAHTVMLCLAGAAGGIVGVNTKRRKPPN